MSSTNASCGRKRSLLRTFGSRRRHKEFAVSASIEAEAVSLTTTKPNHECTIPNSSQCSRSRSTKCAQTPPKPLDEHHASTGKTTSSGGLHAGTPCKQSADWPRDGCRTPPLSPFRMHPVMIARASHISRGPEAPDPRRSSLSKSRSSESTHATRRFTTNSIQTADTADMLRMLDSPVFSPEKNVALSEKPNAAGPIPLIAVQRELHGKGTCSTKTFSNHVHQASAREINHKVVEMMAAIDALKPGTPTRRGSGSKESAQGAQSRGLAKLLGRLYSKSASPESEAFKKRSKLGGGEKGGPLTRSASQPGRNKWTISSTEIRLNEDQNFIRDKIQQMMGVAETGHKTANAAVVSGDADGNSMMRVGSAEEGQEQELTESVRSHGARHESWSYTNPFDTEEDFDCDLEKGILHASPVGSSTPRIRVHRSSDSTLSRYSIQGLRGGSLGQVNVAKVMHIAKSDTTKERMRPLRLGTAPVGSGWSAGACLSPNEEVGTAKKHPSPSKRDLEELEKAFRQYELPPEADGHGDEDELAASRMVLSMRDRN